MTVTHGPLDALVDRYTQERIAGATASRRTALEQRLTLRQFAASFGRRPVGRMSEPDVLRWLGSTAELMPATRRNKLSVVKGFCRWLARSGYLKRDPAAEVRSPRQPRTVPRVFEAGDVALLLDACPDARARLIVLLMCQLGLRAGEVAALEIADFESALVVVHGKGGHQRVIPLVAEVRGALSAYLLQRGGHAGALVQNYQHAGRGLTSHTVSDLVRRLCREAGVKRFAGDGLSAHGLRRTCASDLAEAGVDILDIAAALGHQSVETTRKHYIRHNASKLTKALEGRWYGKRQVEEAG